MKYPATVIKTGNSYALRVSKQYMLDNKLREGQKVSIGAPSGENTYDPEKLKKAILDLQRATANAAPGGLASIKDPVAWQREIRKDRPLPGRS